MVSKKVLQYTVAVLGYFYQLPRFYSQTDDRQTDINKYVHIPDVYPLQY